jgi:hypothetical protein
MKHVLYTFISRDGLRVEKRRLGERTFFPPAPWLATVSPAAQTVEISVLGAAPRGFLRRAIDCRLARFLLFLTLIGGFTALLTASSHALFNVILALGVAGVVSASWKFSA